MWFPQFDAVKFRFLKIRNGLCTIMLREILVSHRLILRYIGPIDKVLLSHFELPLLLLNLIDLKCRFDVGYWPSITLKEMLVSRLILNCFTPKLEMCLPQILLDLFTHILSLINFTWCGCLRLGDCISLILLNLGQIWLCSSRISYGKMRLLDLLSNFLVLLGFIWLHFDVWIVRMRERLLREFYFRGYIKI